MNELPYYEKLALEEGAEVALEAAVSDGLKVTDLMGAHYTAAAMTDEIVQCRNAIRAAKLRLEGRAALLLMERAHLSSERSMLKEVARDLGKAL